MKWLTLALTMVMLSSPVLAEDKPASSQPASKPAAPGAVVEVTDLDTIKANVGKELTVHGKVSGTYKSRTGSVILLNFEGVNRDFVAAVEKDAIDPVNAAFDGDVANAVKGKSVTITGPIKLYREKPEIVISKPEQLKIESGEAEKKEEPEKKE